MDHLEHGRECYRRRAWGEAYHALVCADRATPLEVDDLDCLATAAYLAGRDLEFQRILERLYRVHVECGDRARSARCAFWLALTFLLHGEAGRSHAWTARGQRVVEHHDCVERGYLAVAVAAQQLREGRAAASYASAGQAIAIGESFGDADLTTAGRHAQGRALIQQGEVVAGLERLDEMMLDVVAGELSPIMTGLMYCSVIETCRQAYALGRASEWTSALSSDHKLF